MERLFSYLIERYAGAFPTWLHPTQVVVAPIADAHNEYAKGVAARLRSARVRVEVDSRSERLDRKIRDAKLKKVPYVAVVGAKEVESGHINVQDRGGNKVDTPVDAFLSMITAEIAERRR
jgi:threonyl-tRNA synthetase